MNRALAQPGAYPNTPKRALIFQAAMAACDGWDGVVDGLISNQLQCNATFDPSIATLNGVAVRCPGGADTGDTCLSDAQINALKTINTPTNFHFGSRAERPSTTSGVRISTIFQTCRALNESLVAV